jgi:3-deoxy-D-manno-octulosonate 8-phosphate phosphatase KdsC-like HAD superfamily phosphatase
MEPLTAPSHSWRHGKEAAADSIRDVLQMAARRLSPGDHYVGDAAAEITVLRQVAEKVPIADARAEVLKAIAVLRDRVGR